MPNPETSRMRALSPNYPNPEALNPKPQVLSLHPGYDVLAGKS